MSSSFIGLLTWMQETALSVGIRESTWSYPIIQSTHVLGLCLFLGFAMLWDLRLMNVTLRGVPVSEVNARVMPWTQVGFLLMLITGGLLFWAEPLRFYGNVFFLAKLVALVLAGANAAFFHFFTAGSRLIEWDNSPVSPASAKVAGVISLFLWSLVVIFGRFIAYNWFDPLF